MKKLLSEQLIGALLAELASGHLLEESRFFSNRKICKVWKVSETTSKTALGWLVERRLITVRDRSGYYVAPGAQQRALFLLHRGGFPKLAAPVTWDTRRVTLKFQPVTPGFRIGIVLPGESERDRSLEQQEPGYETMSPEVRELIFALRRNDVELRYYIDNQSAESRALIVDLVRQHGLHGLVAFRRNKEKYRPLAPLIRPLLDSFLPVVTVFDDCEGLNVISVNLNNIAVGYRAARHFLGCGHRRIAVVYPNLHNKYYFERVVGCRMALEAAAASGGSLLEIAETELLGKAGTIDRHFDRENGMPTAVFLTSYDQIAAMLGTLQKLGLAIPRDVSLVVCRGSTTPENFGIPLDSMTMNFAAVGSKAADCLIDLLNGRPTPRSNLIPAHLIKVGSVARLRALK